MYLLYVLGVDGEEIHGNRIYMTEEEYQEDCRREQAYKRRLQEEQEANRKARKFYTCPWADGETFYIPLREEVEGGRMMIEEGYVGTVLVKVGIEDCIVTGNLWPVMLACCVKREYTDIQSLIRDDVFNRGFVPRQLIVTHERNESIPESLKKIGDIPDISARYHDVIKKSRISWRNFENRLPMV